MYVVNVPRLQKLTGFLCLVFLPDFDGDCTNVRFWFPITCPVIGDTAIVKYWVTNAASQQTTNLKVTWVQEGTLFMVFKHENKCNIMRLLSSFIWIVFMWFLVNKSSYLRILINVYAICQKGFLQSYTHSNTHKNF